MDHQEGAIVLPSAIEKYPYIEERLAKKSPVVFLDYDGTLTPIVNDPVQANLSEEMRQVLEQLSAYCNVVIVSGRDRVDVERKVNLDRLYYAGSHGFDITGPNDLKMEQKEAENLLPVFQQAEKELNDILHNIQGAQVERKHYAIAIHYRNVKDDEVEKVKEAADKILREYPLLKKGLGKKIIELKPALDWHKGKALLWIMDKLKLTHDTHVPIYIGDDITDEDAFGVLDNDSFGILVGEHGDDTKAGYSLHDIDEVKLLLQKLITFLKNRP